MNNALCNITNKLAVFWLKNSLRGTQVMGNRPSGGNKMTETLCKPHKDEKSRSLRQGPGGIQL